MPARPAWVLVGLSAGLVAADVVVTAQALPLTSETAVAVHGFPFVHGAALGSAVMAALILGRHPRHPIGWLLSAVGVLTSVSLFAEAYAYWAQQAGGPGPPAVAGVAAWLAQLAGGPAVVALLAFMYLLAPDGRFQSRRWSRAALLPAAGALLSVASIVSVDPRSFRLMADGEELGQARQLLLSTGFTMISLGMLVALLSMAQRLRRSSGEERQRLLPIALSAGLAVVGLVVLAAVQAANGGEQTWLAAMPLFAAFFLMPILFAVAVLRYRLYDLDVILNRAVLVAAGTAFAAVGYTALVVLAGRELAGRTGGYWVSLGVTAVVALAFQPLRRVVVRWTDRAAYGDRAQPYEALADFSRRLAEAPDPDDLLPAVAEEAARAVSARAAVATLDVPGAEPVSGTWGWWGPGDEESPDRVVPVAAGGRSLGRIAVALPRGRSLRPSDLPLLEALAEQTAVAFRNTSLAGALADRVGELDRTTRQLAGSRLRLIAADDAARRALEAAIAREVRPALEAMPRRIGEARASLVAGDDPDLDALVDGTNHALGALRELTRGVFPSQLARTGLEPALRSLLLRAPAQSRLSVSGAGAQRQPPRVEAAVYFCCAEAVGAAGGPLRVDLAGEGELVLRISGAPGVLDRVGVTDRVDAVGGRLEVSGDGLVLRVPLAQPQPSPVG